MQVIAMILVIVSFSMISFQDFSARSYVWWLAPISFLSLLLLSYSSDSLFLETIGQNLLVILLFLGGIFLYALVKKGRFYNPIDQMIGLGDVLFFFILGFGMNTENLVLFIFSTAVLGVVVSGISLLLNRSSRPLFPLAGVQALFYLLLVVGVCEYGNQELFTENLFDLFYLP